MKCSPDSAERGALFRVVAALEQAETELPHLAAPDGTLSINIDDLRSVINQMDRMRDTLALGRMYWIERWYGSDPERGSSICVATEHGAHGRVLAYLGGDENTHKAARDIVAAHNAALNEALSSSTVAR